MHGWSMVILREGRGGGGGGRMVVTVVAVLVVVVAVVRGRVSWFRLCGLIDDDAPRSFVCVFFFCWQVPCSHVLSPRI